MQVYRSAVAGLGVLVLALGSWVLVEAQQPPSPAPAAQVPPPTVPVVPAPRMPIAPPAVMGASVTPALEGWFKNADGTTTIIIGYMNRNQNQSFDIPIGPNNKIEPAGNNPPGLSGLDYGQPTHFMSPAPPPAGGAGGGGGGGGRGGRQYGVFSITVPKDFGTKRLTYTITANGQPQSITLGLANGYMVEPFFRNDNGNTPPVVKIEPTGPELKGPPRGIAQTLTTTVAQPVTLTLYATDKGNTVDQQNQFGPPPPPAGAGRGGDSAAAAGTPPAGGAGAADATGAAGAAGAGRGGRGGGGAGRGGGRGGAAPDNAQAGAPAGAAGAGAGAGGGPGAAAGRGGAGGGRGGGGRPINVLWTKYRGPGKITFANATPEVVSDAEVAKMFTKAGDYSGKATTTATFSEPGEYWVRGQVNDASGDGGGGDQCCWTNVHVKVVVKP